MQAVTRLEANLARLAQEGKVRIGLPNSAEAYACSKLRVPAGVAEHLIDEERGDR
jgi:hypothetical protein